MKTWKSFAAGIIVGIGLMFLFVEMIGPFTFLLAPGPGLVRANRLTGKAERYYNGWEELK